MKRLCLLAAFLALARTSSAQQVPATANLTAQDSGTCTTANACLSINVPKDNASALIQLSGSFTATIQFEASSGQGPSGSPFTPIVGVPITGGTAVASSSAPGAWRVNVASVYVLRVRVSSISGGTTVAAAITSSAATTFSAQSFTPGGGTGTIGGSGTACSIPVFTDASDIGNSNATDCNNIFESTDPEAQPASLYTCPNSASGTTNGLLVTTDSNGNCINIPNGQNINIVGIVYSGGGTSGTALICQIGTCPVILDNQSVIGDCIVPAATGAQGHDSGSSTCPSGVEQIGRATSLNSGAATSANARVFISDVISQSQGQAQVIQVNGTTIAGTNANFNGTTPAAGSNNQNLVFQTNNSSPTSAISVEVPIATTSQLGIIKLAQDLCNTALLPDVCGIQGNPVTFTSIAARDVLCFPTTSTIANCSLGVPVRTVSGNSDTILASDRTSNVRYTAASGATAVGLPQAGTTGFASNITFVLTNAQGSGTVTVTPTTSTINGGSTLPIAAGTYCFVYSDNTNYFANCQAVSASGTVTSVAQTVPSWLTVTGSPITTSGTLAISAATGQTSHQVIGTCGSATSFAPCALVAADVPACSTCVTSVTGSGFLTSSGGTTPAISVAHSQGTDTNLLTSGTVSGTNAILCTDANAGATTSSCAVTGSQLPSTAKIRGLVFSYGDPGNSSAITAGSTATDYMTVPFACTISAYNIVIDAGTITIKFWKVATGTAIPTSGNSISTSGLSISSGTAIHSTTVTDFTSTSVAANDIIAMNVSTVATAKFVSATLECDQ